MPKEKPANPVAAHAKALKTRALKKQKATVAAQRTERLSKRNPDRVQAQIDDLLAVRAAHGGSLRPRDAEQLERLEREVRAIRRAREGKGLPERPERPAREGRDDARRPRENTDAPPRKKHGLGKRRRDERSDSETTDPEARDIPMPEDTPPPVPAPHKRSRQAEAPRAPQTTYSAAPALRDLQKEATARFMPAAVAARARARQSALGIGHESRLLEPEELDRLEGEREAEGAGAGEGRGAGEGKGVEGQGGDLDLEAEEAAFAREAGDGLSGRDGGAADGEARRPGVSVEEVEDEGD